jgi:hypothetical protein
MNKHKIDWLEALAKAANNQYTSPQKVEAIMERANRFMDGHGVEVVTSSNEWCSYFCDARLFYVNMGDAYDLTFMYDVVEHKFSVQSWGDWMEAHDS